MKINLTVFLVLFSLLALGCVDNDISNAEPKIMPTPIEIETTEPVVEDTDTNKTIIIPEEKPAVISTPKPQETKPLGIGDKIFYSNPVYEDALDQTFVIEEIINVDDNWYEMSTKSPIRKVEIPGVCELGFIKVRENLKISSSWVPTTEPTPWTSAYSEKQIFIRASFQDKTTGEIIDLKTIEFAGYASAQPAMKESGEYLKPEEIPDKDLLWQWDLLLTSKVTG